MSRDKGNSSSDENAFHDDLKKLKSKRAFLKRNLTILQQYLDSSTNTPEHINQIKRQFDLCEKSINTYDEFFESIYDADFDSHFEEFFIEREITDATFAKLKLKVSTHYPDTKGSPQTSSHQGLKLPSVNLPTFTGKYDEWLSFRETFNALIDSNNNLSKVEKLQYLISCLKGEAADAIKFLDIIEKNYDNAIEILKERFENKRVIVNNHIRALFEIVALTKESYHGFRNILDTVSQHARSLSSIGRPVDKWDDILVYLIFSKLPFYTRKEWDNKLTSTELPSLKDMTDFLTHKCHTLSSIQSKEFAESSNKGNKVGYKSAACNVATNKLNTCNYCNKNDHFTSQCESFLKLDVQARMENARSNKLCLNCLRRGHQHRDCKSSRCKKCGKLHNTMLHVDHVNKVEANHEIPQEIIASSLYAANPSNIILSTCMVEIKDAQNNYHSARALLDSGSQIHLMTKHLLDRLNLNTSNVNLSITGVNNSFTRSSLTATAEIKSKYNHYKTQLNFYVLDHIAVNMPICNLNHCKINIPNNLQLADPEFYKSRNIDLLIGAQIFYQLLCSGQVRTNHLGLVLQKSVFGWLISGEISNPTITANVSAACNLTTLDDINKNIARFWEIENMTDKPIQSKVEAECERHFVNNVKRDSTGRFLVSLPWNANPNVLGKSLEIAKGRFLNLERKLLRNQETKIDYDAFIKEYLDLGHMKEIGTLDSCIDIGYFLPHHAIYKAESITTKVRVVFDASCKSTSGISLNDILMLGPVLQNDLFSILVRFRFYQHVLCADISKMYRQILIDSKDTIYQKILYRFDSNEAIKVYELQTLTYGFRPASFIATRCLTELASEVHTNDPRLAKVICNDFYMDDLITGGNDQHELIALRDKLIKLLRSAGFVLRKWISNNSNVLEGLDCDRENLVLKNNDYESIKTLGVRWSPRLDSIEYSCNLQFKNERISKRHILSQVSSIFDPLGLLGPVIVIAKLIIQDLWKTKCHWDESLPLELQSRWKEFHNELREISKIAVPRKLITRHTSRIELHGFADASEKAYGACIFLKEVTDNSQINCRILCAKSRVAPLKTVSLPRLELCAAVLLSELMHKVLQANLKCNYSAIKYYSDSTITLSWIHSCPSRWKVFIAHRVAEIQSKSDASSWHHVRSDENPADIISRGSSLTQLASNSLWWNGPKFLHDINVQPKSFKLDLNTSVPEAKVLVMQNLELQDTQATNHFADLIFSKYSSLTRLIRIIALCKRFIFNCQNRDHKGGKQLSVKELSSAENSLIKLEQGIHFKGEIYELKGSRQLKPTSKILALSPFLDSQGILRVGGRLVFSDLQFDSKHPILLPKGLLCNLIISHYHQEMLHSGVQGTLASIRLRFWPVSGRSSVKSIIRNCIVCFKENPNKTEPKMADLPEARVTISRPFSKVGIDFFGPFHIKVGLSRSRTLVKMYGCLFICMAVKAVHCELVENLTTEAFVAALKRFVSRRGLPKEIFCDNATNFVGASNDMKEIITFLKNEKTQNVISQVMITRGISWKFITPRAPHQGGLWEAAVKSFKRHIFKISTNANLTYNEMYTLLTEVECVLNSRPLTPLSTDPNDLTYLTPGHFLIGDYLKSIPEVDLLPESINKLSRWQYVQILQQLFWKKWNCDYLQELQKRNKWKVSKGPILSVGDVVLVREDHTPSRFWKMGIIQTVYPGPDGIVRRAAVKTANGVLERPTVRLSVLPMSS